MKKVGNIERSGNGHFLAAPTKVSVSLTAYLPYSTMEIVVDVESKEEK